MKNLIATLMFSMAALAAPALAAAPPTSAEPVQIASAPIGQQQNKMATCNADAAGKKGDERKAFMKECLSAQKATQQSKMKTCNADAAGKKGDERKAFMKECLSVPSRTIA
jgi:hypothetical protein